MKRLALFLAFAAALAVLVWYIDSRMPAPETPPDRPAGAADAPGAGNPTPAAEEGRGNAAAAETGTPPPPAEGTIPPGETESPLLRPDREKLAVLDAEYPYREKVVTPDGETVDTVTACFWIGRLTPGKANQYDGEKIRFEYYDKARPKLPPEERALARGTAERGILFAASGGGGGLAGGGMDLDFRREFVLEGGVVIHVLDKETGAESVRVDGENLSFFKNRFRSTGPVVLSGEGFSVKGTGLTFDLDSRDFHLDEAVRIEAAGPGLARLAERAKGAREGEAAGEKGRAPEREGGAPPAGEPAAPPEPPLVVTARGGLDLHPPRRNLGPDAAPPLPGTDSALGRMEIRDHVHVSRGPLSLACGRAALTFRELEEGSLELTEFHAWAEGERVRVEQEGRTARCDRLDYRRGEAGEEIRLSGTPELENLALPFPALAAETPGGRPSSGATPGRERIQARVECGDRVEIRPAGGPGKDRDAKEEYRVRLAGGVRVLDAESQGPELLRAEEVTFLLPRGGGAAGGPGPGDLPPVQAFKARGQVSGAIPPFTFAAAGLSMETEPGLQRIALSDPKESRLEGDTFALRSSSVSITARGDLVEVRADTPPFTCTARVEKLPEIRSFDPLGETGGGGSNAGAGPAKGTPPGTETAGPGTFLLEGEGRMRILLRGRGAAAAQTVTTENGPFRMTLRRGEEEALTLEGREALGLDVQAGRLVAMNCRGGGRLQSDALGIEASGETLILAQGEGDVLDFLVKGRAGAGPGDAGTGGAAPAELSFLLPGKGGTCRVRGGTIHVTSGGETRLEAEENVDARIPPELFRRAAAETGGGAAGGKPGDDVEPGKAAESAVAAGAESVPGKTGTRLPGLLFPTRGTYRLRAPRMVLARAEDAEGFELQAVGGVHIANEEAGFEAQCRNFTLNRNPDRVHLQGTKEAPAVVRAAAASDASVIDTASAERIEVDLAEATATLFPGGEIVFHPYDPAHDVFDLFRIRCRDEMVLRENLLELSGRVALAFTGTASGANRRLSCARLRVYFIQSPLIAGVTTWDAKAYRALVNGRTSVPPPDDANRVKRIRAQEGVTFDMDGYTGACALLEWDLLGDEVRCDGLGREIEVAYGGMVSVRGTKILVRPVNEELRVMR